VHSEEVAFEILVRRGGGTNNSLVENTDKGDPTTLPILFYIVMVKKLGSDRNNEKFIT